MTELIFHSVGDYQKALEYYHELLSKSFVPGYNDGLFYALRDLRLIRMSIPKSSFRLECVSLLYKFDDLIECYINYLFYKDRFSVRLFLSILDSSQDSDLIY